MSLFLRTGLVVLINLFIAASALFEFIVNFATLGIRGFNGTEVVKVNSLFAYGCVSLIVSNAFLSKDVRVELFLLLQIGVDFGGSDVARLGSTALSLPVRVCAESSFGFVAIVFNWSLFLVATTEHARLKLLVLLVLSVEARVLVHALRR